MKKNLLLNFLLLSYAHSLAHQYSEKNILTRSPKKKKLLIEKSSFRVTCIVEVKNNKSVHLTTVKLSSFLIEKNFSGKQKWFRTICRIFCPTLGRLKRPSFVLHWRSRNIREPIIKTRLNPWVTSYQIERQILERQKRKQLSLIVLFFLLQKHILTENIIELRFTDPVFFF